MECRNMLMGFLLGFLFMNVVLFANGEATYYDLVIGEATFTKLCSTKSMLTANGSFPGPPIYAHRGQTIYVNVYNNASYGVTVHWHGVRQPRNPWSDGPEMVTQCPIQPGANFTYEIIISKEEGTLWYHAHSDWSRATVHGPIIIYPAHGTTYPFETPDAEETIMIASWYKGDVKLLYDTAMETGGDFNISDAFTINGEPGDLYECSNETTYRLPVEYGKTYLLRIINAVLNEDHFFAIADHNLTVVGHDGAYIKPIVTNYIMITPGQTMDVLVTANQTPSYYYIASTPFFDSIVDFDNTTTTAILEYEGNYTAPSSIPFPDLPSYDDEDAASNFTSQLRSLASHDHPVDVPRHITKHMLVTISINTLLCPNASCDGPDGNRMAASMNNVSFEFPDIDILGAYYRHLTGVYDKDFPSYPPYSFNFTGDADNITAVSEYGTKVKMLDYGDAVEIVFQGTNIGAASIHPIHVHGFSFYIVGKGSGNFDNETDPLSYNLVDPPEVNTASLPKDGWVAIRFYADNPGVWFIHCHFERHLSWGMDTVLIVRNGKTRDTCMLPPPAWMPKCTTSTSLIVEEVGSAFDQFEEF